MRIDTIACYDGHLLHQRFAYQYFREQCSPLGNIIAFRAPMEVLADGMIDQEDVLNTAFIWSDDAINFMWELPVLANNTFGAVTFQRLFNTEIATLLASNVFLDCKVLMNGDDIMVETAEGLGKCSVSITHTVNGAALGHTGINIAAGDKAPTHAYSTQLSCQQVDAFIEMCCERFYALVQDVFVATTKIVSK